MANRKRSIRKEINMNEEEYKSIEKNMVITKMQTFQNYALNMMLYGGITNIDFTELSETRRLVNTIANNVNQIAKRCNETRSIYETDIHAINFEIKELKHQLDNVYYHLRNAASKTS